MSFRHLYFSPDRRGANARGRRREGADQSQGRAAGCQVRRRRPVHVPGFLSRQDREYLGKEFGPPFAAAVGKLPPGSWQGPIESGFGWHLVFVDTVIQARAPAFEEIEPDVKQAWLADQKEKAVKKAYEDMRAKYTVLMPAPPPEGAPPPPKIDPNAAALRSIPDDVIPK